MSTHRDTVAIPLKPQSLNPKASWQHLYILRNPLNSKAPKPKPESLICSCMGYRRHLQCNPYRAGSEAMVMLSTVEIQDMIRRMMRLQVPKVTRMHQHFHACYCRVARSSEAFLAILLMLSWMQQPPPFSDRVYDVLEFFAGCGHISRLSVAAGWHALVHDCIYDKCHEGQNNSMDMNTAAGYLCLGMQSQWVFTMLYHAWHDSFKHTQLTSSQLQACSPDDALQPQSIGVPWCRVLDICLHEQRHDETHMVDSYG